MMTRRLDARRDAPALRFLLLCVGGWIILRIMMAWNPAMSSSSGATGGATPGPTGVPWPAPRPFAASGSPPRSVPRGVARRDVLAIAQRMNRPLVSIATSARHATPPPDAEPVSGGLGADRHNLRLALFARLLPPPSGAATRSAMPAGGRLWLPLAPTARADPGQGKPFWIRQGLAGWSLVGWLYLREGSDRAPDTLGAASQLGGSQAGLRFGYGFGDAGRARAYGRATLAVQRPQQREVAFGLAFAPLAHLPVDVAIEQRVALGREGRTVLAIMASGGVSEVALPAGFRLDAYAQAGVVGMRRRDGFADGAVVVDRRLGASETSLRLGALAAGAIQPGAGRVDVGPRLTLRLPDVGKGSRIALDWRQRVAGDARPESGLALTLASDF